VHPYGPRELVQIEDGRWLPRGPDEPSSPSAEDEYFATLEPTVDDILDSAGLTDKQRFVIELRTGMRGGRKHTIREIATLMGVFPNSVFELERAAKRKLYKTLDTRAESA
jgi:DNA-directed RNA polymerase sigma subunit (sigma70/sigma32)